MRRVKELIRLSEHGLSVRNDLMGAKPLPLAAVYQAFLSLPLLQPLDERLAACILGGQGVRTAGRGQLDR